MHWYALIVMLADDGLYGLCTRHCRLLAHERSYCSEAVPAYSREVPEQRWSDMVLQLQLVHDSQVFLLLFPHFLQHTFSSARASQWGGC